MSNTLNLLQHIIGDGSDSAGSSEREEDTRKESTVNASHLEQPPSSDSSAHLIKMGNSVDAMSESDTNSKYETFLQGNKVAPSASYDHDHNNRSNSDKASRDKHRERSERQCDNREEVVFNSRKKITKKPAHADLRDVESQNIIKAPVKVAVQKENVKREQKEPHSDDSDKHIAVASEQKTVVARKPILKKKKRKVRREIVVEPYEDTTSPERSQKDTATDLDSTSDRHEVMSDQALPPRGQRKLAKRAPMRKFRSLEINPNVFYEEKIKQKYDELKELIAGNVTQKDVSRQHLGKMEALRQQYANVSHGLPPQDPHGLRSAPMERPYSQGGRSENDQAYSTLRRIQVNNHGRPPPSRPWSAAPSQHSQNNRAHSHAKSGRENSIERYSKSHRYRNRSHSPKSKPLPDVENHHENKDDQDKEKHIFPQSDHQLKNTDNDLIKTWLKQKNVLIRKQKTEERKKKRAERKQADVVVVEKNQKHVESEEKVRAWMNVKRHEACEKQKKERLQRKQMTEERTIQENKRISTISGQRLHTPEPAPLYRSRRVIRPEGLMGNVEDPTVAGEETTESVRKELLRNQSDEEETKQTNISVNIQMEGPCPPKSKFVYRRPVLGRVRLKVQQKENVAKGTEKPKKNKTTDKKQIHPRRSYDQWICDNRKTENETISDDVTPQSVSKSCPDKNSIEKDIKKENELNRSDINTNDINGNGTTTAQLDLVTNKVVREVLNSVEGELEESQNKESSEKDRHFMTIVGSKASVSSRPQSAHTITVPYPQVSKSPRRPVSANPHYKSLQENGPDGTTLHGSVPFPPEMGVPKNVESMQRKIFSSNMWDPFEEVQRPEPQGCDDGLDKLLTEKNYDDSDQTRFSMDTKTKRVSFCETMTVFEDEEQEGLGEDDQDGQDEDDQGHGEDDQGRDEDQVPSSEMVDPDSEKIFITEEFNLM